MIRALGINGHKQVQDSVSVDYATPIIKSRRSYEAVMCI